MENMSPSRIMNLPVYSNINCKRQTFFHQSHFRFPFTFRRFLETLRVGLRNSTPRFRSLPEQGNKYIKYFILPYGNRTHNRRFYRLACTPVPRRRQHENTYLYQTHYCTIRNVLFLPGNTTTLVNLETTCRLKYSGISLNRGAVLR